MIAKASNRQKELGIILLLALVSLTTLHPMLASFTSKLPYASNGDIRLSLSILFSNLQNIRHLQLRQIYHLPIAFPFSYAMTAGVNLFGQSLLLLPLYLAGLHNVYLWYNLLTLVAFVASGYCAYLLFRDLCTSRPIAVIIAAAYMLLPFRVHNIPQLNLMYNFPIPLAFFFFRRFLLDEKRHDLIFFAVTFFLQLLFDLSLAPFLAVGLAIYFVLHGLVSGPKKNVRFYLALIAAAAVLLVLLIAFFTPYLRKEISFSNLPEVQSIPEQAFHPALSFYNNWNSLLLGAKRILWAVNPFSPGFLPSALFLLAFWPALASRLHKALFGLMTALLLLPALAVIIFFRRIPIPELARLATICLSLLLAAVIAMVISLRQRLSAETKIFALAWAIMLFFSSTIAWHSVNLFQLLGRLFPLFRRTRGIRTQYIIMLLFFALAAIGFQQMWRKYGQRKLMFALLSLLLIGERLRWSVYMEKLADDRPEYKAFYGQLQSLPADYGLLELPFHHEDLNYYTLYTRFHRQHTTHGFINYIIDPLQLEQMPQWQKESGFPGLKDPAAIAALCSSHIRIILLFRDKFPAERTADRQAWAEVQENVRLGKELGLFEKVEKSKTGIMLLLSGRQSGTEISTAIPYFALAAKRGLRFSLSGTEAAHLQVSWNGKSVAGFSLAAGERKEMMVPLAEFALLSQQNSLYIRSDRPVTFDNLTLEK